MTEEQFILKQIADLKQEYEKLIQPLVKRLSAIRAAQPVRFFITAEQYNQMKEYLRDHQTNI